MRATPAVPMNSAGKIGPPTNPLAWQTAKVTIFAITRATSNRSLEEDATDRLDFLRGGESERGPDSGWALRGV